MQAFRLQAAQWTGNHGFALAVCGGVLVGFLAFVIYWPAWNNGFVLDDWAVMQTLSGIGETASWWEVLLSPPADYAVLFRPLTMFTFLLHLWAGHLEPGPFHVVNLVIHSAGACLFTLVAWQWLGDDEPQALARPVWAAFSGFIYAIHPALTEPVIWISARSDLLMVFFLCLALFFDRAFLASHLKRSLAVGAAFFVAMLAKETAIGFMAALPVVHLAASREPFSMSEPGSLVRVLAKNSWVYATLLGACLLYLAVRFMVAGPSFGLDNTVSPARYINTLGQHVMVVVATLAYQVRDAIWPFQNIVPVRHLPLPINAMEVLPVVVASASVVAAALLAACSRYAIRVPALLFIAFFVSLLPIANIVPIPAVAVPNEIGVASRYLAFPLIFACLGASLLMRFTVTSLLKHVRYGQALLLVVAGAWVLASIANVRVILPLWKNDAVLSSWAIEAGGASFWRYAHYGLHQMRAGNLRQARDAFVTAVELRDDEYSAWVWDYLGAAEAGLGNPVQAMRAFRHVLELGGDEVRTRINMARLELAMGNSKSAVEVLEEGVRNIQRPDRMHKQEARLRYELGLAYARLGRAADAAIQLNAALTLARNSQERRAIEDALLSVAPR